MHTHVVVSKKVQLLPEGGGRWLTVDGRMLFKSTVMASEHDNTHLEARPERTITPPSQVPFPGSVSVPRTARSGPRPREC
ncbi:hypothetical protein FNH13_01455 [Ornithinimicrobium ciconiae]|uniref:TrwC relaxase domain-containing protein n=1 Tax=Ornithinimicrobium ciconiae TaxID=2594265 RepID=A0A516GFP7_9MICO|nr:hypothetical protein FNH13_01455 [Ornithinimicrobium ciconiae]